MRWTEEQLKAFQTGLHAKPVVTTAGRTKHGNKRTLEDGIWFDSQHEARKYRELQFMKAGGAIRGFTRQVTLPLSSGKRRLRIDFMVVENDGRVRFIDAKGFATDTWKTKRDEIEHQLGIKIETV